MKKKEIFLNGLFLQNPVLVMLLGLCPILGTTTSLNNAFGMSLAVLFVLVFSNFIISAIKSIVPHAVRIPVYIIIIATLVSIIDLLLKAFAQELSNSLGAFIPLITVNCLVLGRGEAFASKNSVTDSLIDGLGMGGGNAIALFIISFIREVLATGGITIVNPFGNQTLFSFTPLKDFALPFFFSNIGAFLVLAFVISIVGLRSQKKYVERRT